MINKGWVKPIPKFSDDAGIAPPKAIDSEESDEFEFVIEKESV